MVDVTESVNFRVNVCISVYINVFMPRYVNLKQLNTMTVVGIPLLQNTLRKAKIFDVSYILR